MNPKMKTTSKMNMNPKMKTTQKIKMTSKIRKEHPKNYENLEKNDPKYEDYLKIQETTKKDYPHRRRQF